MPGSVLEIFESSGHFPHHTETERFVGALTAFLDRSAGAQVTAEDLRGLLRSGS